jgi:dTDP-4-amino-4,6-dideoxygalactose transaminase
MWNFAPNPRYRIYTTPNSYLSFLRDILKGCLQKDVKDRERLEDALSKQLGIRHTACVPQNRVGMYLTVKALVAPGKEVIMSPYTIADITNMVICAGGRPVFADVERETCNIAVSEIERLIHPETGAVLITHLHGLAAEATKIKEICDRFQVPLIEDCAQAFGTREQGKPVGTIGEAGIFSFGMYKNINTWLGGAVVSNRDDIIEKIRAELAGFSHPPLPYLFQKIKSGLITDIATSPPIFKLFTYWVFRFGFLYDIDFINRFVTIELDTSRKDELPESYKSQMTPFQARLALSQLNRIERDSQIRIENGLRYYEGLKDIKELIIPPARRDFSHIYTYFPIQYPQRKDLIKFMMKHCRDVAAQHYKNNADLPDFQEFYRDCPNARKVSQELIFLPTYPRYSRREVEKNIAVIRKYFGYQ